VGSFGLGLILAAAASAIGWLLVRDDGAMTPPVPAPVLQGDGDAGQGVGVGVLDVQAVTVPGTGVEGVMLSGKIAGTGADEPPEPVTPPRGGVFVPNWTNPTVE
jgi:hypothetical protein